MGSVCMPCAVNTSFIMLVFFLSLALVNSAFSQDDCSVFQEGSCPLDENNIVGLTSQVDNAAACQTICKYMYPNHECQFFTHFAEECYQLANCTFVEPCPGCVSGPLAPDFGSCPWPPMNETTTMEPTTVTDEDTTTELPATTTAEEVTTTEAETEPPTTMPTEPTRPACETRVGSLCAQEGNLIEHIEHIHDTSDCQAICQNHPNCEYWSHYLEEGHEHFGHCWLHYSCDRFEQEAECFHGDAHECRNVVPPMIGEPRPGGRKCYCENGANSPDVDDCGELPPTPLPCMDDFFSGVLCDEDDIGHIEGITDVSDCQAICQNHDGCEFFSHYVEEGPESWGHCWLFAQCRWVYDDECAGQFEDICNDWPLDVAVPFPGRRCGCFSGPSYPDLDDCSASDLF